MITYRPLFITLAKKDMELNDLVRNGVVSTATQAQFKKNNYVSLSTVAKICNFLDVPIEEVVEVKRD